MVSHEHQRVAHAHYADSSLLAFATAVNDIIALHKHAVWRSRVYSITLSGYIVSRKSRTACWLIEEDVDQRYQWHFSCSARSVQVCSSREGVNHLHKYLAFWNRISDGRPDDRWSSGLLFFFRLERAESVSRGFRFPIRYMHSPFVWPMFTRCTRLCCLLLNSVRESRWSAITADKQNDSRAVVGFVVLLQASGTARCMGDCWRLGEIGKYWFYKLIDTIELCD